MAQLSENESAPEELLALAADLDAFAATLAAREAMLQRRETRVCERELALAEREAAIMGTWNDVEDAASIGVRCAVAAAAADVGDDGDRGAAGRSGGSNAMEGAFGAEDTAITAQQSRIEQLARALNESPARMSTHQQAQSDLQACIARVSKLAGATRSATRHMDVLLPRFTDEVEAMTGDPESRTGDSRVQRGNNGLLYVRNLLGQRVLLTDVAGRPKQSVTERKNAHIARTTASRLKRNAEVRRIQRGEHRQPQLPIYAHHHGRPQQPPPPPPPPPPTSASPAHMSTSDPPSRPEHCCTNCKKQQARLLQREYQLHTRGLALAQREQAVACGEEALRLARRRLEAKLRLGKHHLPNSQQQTTPLSAANTVAGEALRGASNDSGPSDGNAILIADLPRASGSPPAEGEWGGQCAGSETPLDRSILAAQEGAIECVLQLFRQHLATPPACAPTRSGGGISLPLDDVERVVEMLCNIQQASSLQWGGGGCTDGGRGGSES